MNEKNAMTSQIHGENIPHSKKQMIVVLSLLIITLAFLLGGCVPADQNTGQGENLDQSEDLDFFAMNTVMNVKAYGANTSAFLEESEQLIYQLEGLVSTTVETSDISRINRQEGGSTKVNPETKDLIKFAIKMASRTKGAFDPAIYPIVKAWGFTTDTYRIPGEDELASLLKQVDYRKITVGEGDEISVEPQMEIDLGGITKGYAGDLVMALFSERGIQSAIINLGGNVQTLGHKPNGENWKIGIRDPKSEGYLGILSVGQKAVVTSGGYERHFTGDDGKVYHHIIDPKTGYPVDNGLISVTIVADQGVLADSLSTALYVMGTEEAIAHWREHQDFEFILVDDEGRIMISQGIKDDFEMEKNVISTYQVEAIQPK